METTLTVENGSQTDIQLLIDIANKLGIKLRRNKKEEKYEEMMALAKKLDESILPNDITMDEIVEEVNIVRRERYERSKNNH